MMVTFAGLQFTDLETYSDTLLLNTLVCYIDLSHKILPSTLVIFRLFLNIFRTTTGFLTITINPVIELIYSWQSRGYFQNIVGIQKQSSSSVQLKRCSVKRHKFHRKASVMNSLFHKTISPHACNCTKKDAITNVSQ